MHKKYHIQRREFLNLRTDMRAYIIAVVEDAREKHVCCKGSDDYNEIALRIADCSQEIELYFDLETFEDRQNSLHKVRLLAEVINEFRSAIEREIEVINARDSVHRHTRAASAVH
ncbi:MAG: hypothetical protein IPM21_00440 [Acidobacteria bacterium]|nr:hypothetical protein [Acidobacteriota bacterium]